MKQLKKIGRLFDRFRGVSLANVEMDGNDYMIFLKCRFKKSLAAISETVRLGVTIVVLPDDCMQSVTYCVCVPDDPKTIFDMVCMLEESLETFPVVNKDFVLFN